MAAFVEKKQTVLICTKHLRPAAASERKMYRLLALLFMCFCIKNALCQSPKYEEKFFDQRLDHFNFVSYGDKTFKQRYLVQDQWWFKGVGPIFFYTGNEGPITAFWDVTGFVFDIAPQFGALVVFAEHRYYGKSLPFGNDTFRPENMGLLTVEQAMADYAVLIDYLKVSMNAASCPVIAFGGSYGGMLSAYMRFKYPNLVTGSIAASAPIYLMSPDQDRNFFFDLVTADFTDAMPGCDTNIKDAFKKIMDIAARGTSGYKQLSVIFNLCKPLADKGDFNHLLGWIRNSLSNLAMFDYPYPAYFFSNLPANPVKYACSVISETSDVVKGLASAAGLFYNGTDGTLQCYDIFSEFVECADQSGCGTGTDSMAWDFQACTEIELTNGSNNKTDMFPSMPFTDEMRREYCSKRWGVQPRETWGKLQFWGHDISTATNIVFSNGDLDPWHGAGVTKKPNSDVEVVKIEGGAHHLDLRGHNPADPISVMAAREVEKQAIRKWINS